jgi:mRNA-degrading endonuclease RelE of RelBE toxin-antitoxin system
MVFVELAAFASFREARWTDEAFRALQSFLLASPAVGDVIPGTNGLRKLRWAIAGRGKSAGARVIYYWAASTGTVYLIFAYEKSKQSDLTQRQIRVLGALMRNIGNE